MELSEFLKGVKAAIDTSGFELDGQANLKVCLDDNGHVTGASGNILHLWISGRNEPVQPTSGPTASP